MCHHPIFEVIRIPSNEVVHCFLVFFHPERPRLPGMGKRYRGPDSANRAHRRTISRGAGVHGRESRGHETGMGAANRSGGDPLAPGAAVRCGGTGRLARISHPRQPGWRRHSCQMPLCFREIDVPHRLWGGPPGPGVPSGDDVLVGLPAPGNNWFHWAKGVRSGRADQGVCPTTSAEFPFLGERN